LGDITEMKSDPPCMIIGGVYSKESPQQEAPQPLPENM